MVRRSWMQCICGKEMIPRQDESEIYYYCKECGQIDRFCPWCHEARIVLDLDADLQSLICVQKCGWVAYLPLRQSRFTKSNYGYAQLMRAPKRR
jgi:hypothetical protein